jgi:hypothetical protein
MFEGSPRRSETGRVRVKTVHPEHKRLNQITRIKAKAIGNKERILPESLAIGLLQKFEEELSQSNRQSKQRVRCLRVMAKLHRRVPGLFRAGKLA